MIRVIPIGIDNFRVLREAAEEKVRNQESQRVDKESGQESGRERQNGDDQKEAVSARRP